MENWKKKKKNKRKNDKCHKIGKENIFSPVFLLGPLSSQALCNECVAQKRTKKKTKTNLVINDGYQKKTFPLAHKHKEPKQIQKGLIPWKKSKNKTHNNCFEKRMT